MVESLQIARHLLAIWVEALHLHAHAPHQVVEEATPDGSLEVRLLFEVIIFSNLPIRLSEPSP